MEPTKIDVTEWIQPNVDGGVTFCTKCPNNPKCPTGRISDDGKAVVGEFGQEVAFGREQALALAAWIHEQELAGNLK